MKINYKDAYESSRIFIDMLKKENEHLNLQLDQALKDYDELQQRIDKTVNYIKEECWNFIYKEYDYDCIREDDVIKILNILQGDDKE